MHLNAFSRANGPEYIPLYFNLPVKPRGAPESASEEAGDRDGLLQKKQPLHEWLFGAGRAYLR